MIFLKSTQRKKEREREKKKKLPFSEEDKINVLSRRSVSIWNTKPYISFSTINLLNSALVVTKYNQSVKSAKWVKERVLPVTDGEDSSGTGGFVIGKLVVVEETADEFVD